MSTFFTAVFILASLFCLASITNARAVRMARLRVKKSYRDPSPQSYWMPAVYGLPVSVSGVCFSVASYDVNTNIQRVLIILGLAILVATPAIGILRGVRK